MTFVKNFQKHIQKPCKIRIYYTFLILFSTGGNPINFVPNVHTNATIHTTSGYNLPTATYADYTSQPMSATNEWNRTSLASSQGPPGYPSAIGMSFF